MTSLTRTLAILALAGSMTAGIAIAPNSANAQDSTLLGAGAGAGAGAGIGFALGGPVGAVAGGLIGAGVGAGSGHAIGDAEKRDDAAKRDRYYDARQQYDPYTGRPRY
jgi:outer membrane lipoprotein SlyB